MRPEAPPAAAIWHDVECGAYSADLEFWTAIADESAGPVLELGSGTGRVSLRLAQTGHEVVAVDISAALLGELDERARAADLSLETVCADARGLDLGRSFGAVLAPMQFVHLLGGSDGRAAMLAAARDHLAPDGLLAAAVLAEDAEAVARGPGLPPLPDVRELGGWIYSSLPLEVAPVAGGVEIRRLRQVVSPAGALRETTDAVRLDGFGVEDFEAEAALLGWQPRRRIEVPATTDHVGSTICVLEAAR